jgi:hypothetical protein
MRKRFGKVMFLVIVGSQFLVSSVSAQNLCRDTQKQMKSVCAELQTGKGKALKISVRRDKQRQCRIATNKLNSCLSAISRRGRELACAQVYKPVCAVFEGGKTQSFSNRCEATNATQYSSPQMIVDGECVRKISLVK